MATKLEETILDCRACGVPRKHIRTARAARGSRIVELLVVVVLILLAPPVGAVMFVLWLLVVVLNTPIGGKGKWVCDTCGNKR